MNDVQIKEYTARISQANKSELVVILYELFLYSVDTAVKAFHDDDKDNAVKYLKKAQGCIGELRSSLDFKYELSDNLNEIYRYVNVQLVASIAKLEPVNLDEVRKMMDKLMASFVEVAKKDTSKTVVQNSQQVYAGLTYGKNSLNEVFMNGDEASRGFKA